MRTPLQIDKNLVWQLQKALKDDYDQKVKLKIRALLLIARGKLVTQASDALAIEQRTVRNWVHQRVGWTDFLSTRFRVIPVKAGIQHKTASGVKNFAVIRNAFARADWFPVSA